MATILSDAFLTFKQGLDFIMSVPILMVPIGLSIGSLVIVKVKKAIKG